MSSKTLIIAYHSIEGDNHLSISKEMFIKQILYLKKKRYVFSNFSGVAEIKKSYPKKKIACIYFDDGFKDVLTNAYPILKGENIPATLFLAIDYIDQKKFQGVYLTWDEVNNMSDVFEFGSHSLSHRKLNKISLEEAREEMFLSKRIIEDRTGTKVVSFSYPKGRVSPELEELSNELGYINTTAQKRFSRIRPDPENSMITFKLKILFS
ncbi:polysaccharide deacetylase family protein [Patescibacteria group bacterium]